jgi:hypothetical protein
MKTTEEVIHLNNMKVMMRRLFKMKLRMADPQKPTKRREKEIRKRRSNKIKQITMVAVNLMDK